MIADHIDRPLRNCVGQRIEDAVIDALCADDGPDDRARNAIESSRDWRAPATRRRSRFSAGLSARPIPSPSSSRRFP